MAATFDALRDRVENGPGFRGPFTQAFAREIRLNEELRADAEDIIAKIGRLMAVVERGVDTEHVTERILALQDELDQVRAKIRVEASPMLPDELTIRAILLDAVQAIEGSGDVERQRVLFKCVLEAITLTPIANRRAGETVRIALREEGWPEFWQIAASEA
jgi:hypothetical protein